ncbi:DEAD-box ATP-dependent RNA helicase 38-like [Capsella rubella]|uniref:DEAD-box ATP-dependent RNA helicase 38-like n=1 Tax=Capsella rubella TaxID=81985 RepID=UPI000CD57489|nr:DEAD-box ATP-dependent RNA helicase 38-like [Capsella rubella]
MSPKPLFLLVISEEVLFDTGKLVVSTVLTQVLIATDVIARGFDQKQVNLVVNYNLPCTYNTEEPNYEVYLHRVGRAGRFGGKGAVFNLLLDDGWDKEAMEKIEKYFGANVKEITTWNSEEEYKAALKEAGNM